MKTLLLIDIQNDFMPFGNLPVPQGDAIIPFVNKLIEQFENVVATQDWHPKEHFSFANNHPMKKPFDTICHQGYSQILWNQHCIQGQWGADFHKELNTNPIKAIFRKGTDPKIDSYSGFFDNLRLKQTGLCGYLKSIGTTELHMVGLAADYCVYYSIKDALELGFEVTLHQEGTRAINEENFKNILEKELLLHKNFKLI